MLWMNAPKFALVCAYSKSILECVYCENNTCVLIMPTKFGRSGHA